MEPINIKTLDSNLTFTVDGELLRAKGKVSLSGKQQFSFKMSEISDEPDIYERRHGLFVVGVILLVFTLASFFSVPHASIRVLLYSIYAVCIITGCILIGRFYRPEEVLTFKNHAGIGLFSLTRTIHNASDVERLLEIFRKEYRSA